jgi:hypothetical protein
MSDRPSSEKNELRLSKRAARVELYCRRRSAEAEKLYFNKSLFSQPLPTEFEKKIQDMKNGQ